MDQYMIDGVVMKFIEAVYPENPHLAIETFNERICLEDATKLITALRTQVAEQGEGLEKVLFGADHMDAAITRMNARLDSPRYLVEAQGVYRKKKTEAFLHPPEAGEKEE